MKKKYIYIGICIFLLAFISSALTVFDYGITWDEPIYISYILHQVDWLDSPHPFSKTTIEKFWRFEPHPPLVKYIMSGGLLLLYKFIGILYASRIAMCLLFSFLIVSVYFFSLKYYNIHAAIFSSLSLFLMPRVFAHGHFAAYDIPVALVWFVVCWAFIKGTSSLKWSIFTGIICGLALLTKENAVFLIIPLLLWGQIYRRKFYARNICFMLPLSLIVLIALWPRLWYDPFSNLIKFFLYHVKHNPINVFYLGKTYGAQIAPWHYPFLLLATTVPPATLLLSIYGICTYIKKRLKDEISGMVIINILFLLILMSLPIAQKYDGIRLFMPVFPFLAVLAGIGFSELYKRVSIVKKYKFLPNTLYLLLLPALITLVRIHPYQTSYYNMFIGGIRGAHKLGMETTYWGDCITKKTLKFINDNTSRNGCVIFFPVGSFVPGFYKKTGFLRKDIKITDINDENFDYLILLSRQGMFTDKVWKIYKHAQSIYEVSYQEVHFLKIYKRDVLLPKSLLLKSHHKR
ncbi:glycosyltransferase family 39 protein [bacterium]|nr:glycosyltransferase family 39 protein [bacterium]